MQQRTFWALVIRQLHIAQGRNQSFLPFFGILQGVINPLIVMTVFRTLNTDFTIYSPKVFLHLLVGVVMCRIFMRTAMDCLNLKKPTDIAVNANGGTPFLMFLAAGIVNFYLFMVFFIILCSLYHYFWYPIVIADWRNILYGALLLMFLGLGVGMVLNAVIGHYPFLGAPFRLVLGMLFLVSGVIFDPANAAAKFRVILEWNPVTIGMQIVRTGFGMATNSSFLNVGYMMAVVVAALSCGLFLGRRIWRPDSV